MSVCECATERVSASVMHVCVCVSVNVRAWGDGWRGMDRASPSASVSGALPSLHLCSLSPAPLLFLFTFPPPFLRPPSLWQGRLL